MFFEKKIEERSQKKECFWMVVMALLMVSCIKDPAPSTKPFQLLKEKEKISVGTDCVTLIGEYAYSGVIDGMKLRVSDEEHLYGSDDYEVTLNGNSFFVEVTGLQPSTLYYYKYIVDYGSVTDWYSDIYTFTTASDEIHLPVLATVQVTGVGTMAASCLCQVVDDGGAEVTERGACWDTRPHPDNTSHVFANGGGLGEYTVDMTGLEPNTIYYVRAYAKNSKGIGYGEELSFTTQEVLEAPLGCLNGLFTVSEERQVWFSQGNLQYHPLLSEWGFAEYQPLYIGDGNTQIGPDYDGWIDLFGWGTSGFDHGAVCYQPWSTSPDVEKYHAYGSWEYNLNDQTGQADWGYGIEVEEGQEAHPFRTLSSDEWEYLFHERSTASGIRFARAQVGGVNGFLLLPDHWSSSMYYLNNVNQEEASYGSNTMTLATFEDLESNGAVFLPAAGRRTDDEVWDVGSYGWYWSSSAYGERKALSLYFKEDYLGTQSANRSTGCAVRLVYDCPVR